METGAETHRLRQEIERALRRAFDPADVLPRLARLARLAPPASDDSVFAHRQLAELLVERHPWRAALYARRALAHGREDDRAWAVLAFCQTLLGNFRCAAKAYKSAIACAPGNPWYAHNLGHLLDVAIGAPERALPWLRAAYGAKGDNSEIVASYVHALARAGRPGEARRILEAALARGASRELEALLRWLDQGAPARGARADGRGRTRPSATSPAELADDVAAGARSVGARSTKRSPASGTSARRVPHLARILERGLSHLPLDSRQRERALLLAGDVQGRAAGQGRAADRPARRDVADLAAAVAYAIVYVDHVPLSQAEVAAPFRVAVGRLRGRFAELRAELDIVKGDSRYATTGR